MRWSVACIRASMVLTRSARSPRSPLVFVLIKLHQDGKDPVRYFTRQLELFPQTLSDPFLNFTIWRRGPIGLRFYSAMLLRPTHGHVGHRTQRPEVLNGGTPSIVPRIWTVRFIRPDQVACRDLA